MTSTRKLDLTFLGVAVLWLAIVAWLFIVTPENRDGGFGWTQPLIAQGWMAWTLPTALFFHFIAGLLLLFSWLGLRFPETPRRGILGIDTTRGDRLFMTLLGSAFINLIWLGFGIGPQPWALLACLVYAATVFRWV
ncbi:DUF2160 domain-containing protein [Roseovarius salinarum]|uniref:DUF2160 domain-containing protein n=1 Tax=Roseovarius salinarum TaxID=1981892 RepID=UPI000C34B1C8|nr:DUF2160 domain-containing protein [Roseovarius salinarum]